MMITHRQVFHATPCGAGTGTAAALSRVFHGRRKESVFMLSLAKFVVVSTSVRRKRHNTVLRDHTQI